MEDAISDSLRAVQGWVERHRYMGYDPGDGLTSFLRVLTFGNLFAERVVQQVIWKAPFNIRRIVGVVPLDSTKGRGFMAWGFLLRYRATKQKDDLDKAMQCLHWLNTNREYGYSGHCWGNHFDFTTRSGRMKAHTPTIVWTGLIGQAFLEAYEVTKDVWLLDVAESICEWIVRLPREVTSTGDCLSYTGVSQNSVHNSSLLGAAMLAKAAEYRPNKEYNEVARRAVQYSCARQRSDGSWWYGEERKYQWIDSFHTAYNLDSIKRYMESSHDRSFCGNLNRGYEYYKRTFFEKCGRPRYYHCKTYPVDIQCAAQAIDTFSFFADYDKEALVLAERIAVWTISNMQSPSGHFYYRQYPLMTAKTPYFHWGQATMFKALANLQGRLHQRDQRLSADEHPGPGSLLSTSGILPAKRVL